MGRSIIMHIDEAPWVRREPSSRGQDTLFGKQFIGDPEKGPWLYINSVTPGAVAAPHSHTMDEIIFIVEGELLLGDRTCGPGTVIFMEHGTVYTFTAGENGARFLNIRSGLAELQWVDRP